jgi:uncharacterized protein YhbP (UPF0306 family)
MRRRSEQLETIAALLRAESTLALGTTGEQGETRVTPLFYIADAELNLYWLSSSASLHSRNLRENPLASAAVYWHTERWKEIRGVQMLGNVQVVPSPQRRSELVKAYCDRFRLESMLRLAIRRSTLYSFHPHWFRYMDNSKRLGYRFEVVR